MLNKILIGLLISATVAGAVFLVFKLKKNQDKGVAKKPKTVQEIAQSIGNKINAGTVSTGNDPAEVSLN